MAEAEEVPTVLVTGASGYIATHIVQQLQKSGLYKVRGTVRSTKNEAKVAPLKNLCPDAKYPLELVEGDLLDEKPWPEAVKGCTYVLHTASPFPAGRPRHEDEIIKPAVDGTLNVLRACKSAGVKRVVLTSSVVAIYGGLAGNRPCSEEDWPDISKPMESYAKSQKRAAWDFVKELPDDEKFELATINPSYVIGPVLCGSFTTSQEVPKRMLERAMPMVPKTHFSVVDVRDVAKAHINAMTVPEAAGNRHILAGDEGWFKDMALILDEEFGPQGYKVPTREAPNFLIHLTGIFDPTVRMIVPGLGKKTLMKSDRMTSVLGITPITMKQSLIDMAYSMIEAGKIKKTAQYKGPPSEK